MKFNPNRAVGHSEERFKVKFRVLAIIVATLTSFACDSDRSVNSQNSGRINFANLEVGQSSRYVRFAGEDYFAPDDSSFVYFPDTLIVTVVAKDGGWFTIEERISAGSLARRDSAHADSARLRNLAKVYTNRVAIINDSLNVEPSSTNFVESYLFQVDGALCLEPFTEPEIVLHGWKTDPCGCNFQGIVSIYTQLGNEYQNLNVVVNNEPMQYDAGGITFVYSREDGLVHVYGVSYWEPRSYGWDLL